MVKRGRYTCPRWRSEFSTAPESENRREIRTVKRIEPQISTPPLWGSELVLMVGAEDRRLTAIHRLYTKLLPDFIAAKKTDERRREQQADRKREDGIQQNREERDFRTGGRKSGMAEAYSPLDKSSMPSQ